MTAQPTAPAPDLSTARGCARPIRLASAGAVDYETGEFFPPKSIYMPCGSRRESRCPACSRLYNGDAFQLLRLGLTSPKTRLSLPLFVTLTAPGADVFGSGHHGTRKSGGHCGCGKVHAYGDPILGAPLNSESFRYDRAVAWNAAAPELWRRFTVSVRRAFPDHDIEYARVIEFQRRGLVHVHAIVRLQLRDSEDRVPLPTAAAASAAILKAVSEVSFTAPGLDVPATWGTQTKVDEIKPKPPKRLPAESDWDYEERKRDNPDFQGAASYIAKYATKAAEDTLTKAEGPLLDHLSRLHKVAWEVAGPKWRRLAEAAEAAAGFTTLGKGWAFLVRMGRARSEAAAYGFTGQVLTKSRNYSTTFSALRERRRAWAAEQCRAAGRSTAVHEWVVAGFGLLPDPLPAVAPAPPQQLALPLVT